MAFDFLKCAYPCTCTIRCCGLSQPRLQDKPCQRGRIPNIKGTRNLQGRGLWLREVAGTARKLELELMKDFVFVWDFGVLFLTNSAGSCLVKTELKGLGLRMQLEKG